MKKKMKLHLLKKYNLSIILREKRASTLRIHLLHMLWLRENCNRRLLRAFEMIETTRFTPQTCFHYIRSMRVGLRCPRLGELFIRVEDLHTLPLKRWVYQMEDLEIPTITLLMPKTANHEAHQEQ